MYKKKFMTPNDQIKLLKERKLQILPASEGKLSWYIKSYNYQNFVNGYNDCLMKNFDRNSNEYRSDVNSDNLIDIFNFDRNICTLLLTNIQNIERMLNTSIAFCTSRKLDVLNYPHANILEIKDDVLNQIFKNNKVKKEAIQLLKNSFINAKSDLSKKYENDIESAPLWSLSIYLSFGETCTIYRNLVYSLKEEIVEIYFMKKFNDWHDLYIIMFLLKNIRNRICHNNVLFNIKVDNHKRTIIKYAKKYNIFNDQHIRLFQIVKIIDFLTNSNGGLEQKVISKFHSFFCVEKGFSNKTIDRLAKIVDIK